jgi:hypothetical protein
MIVYVVSFDLDLSVDSWRGGDECVWDWMFGDKCPEEVANSEVIFSSVHV